MIRNTRPRLRPGTGRLMWTTTLREGKVYKLRDTLEQIKCEFKEEFPNQGVCCRAVMIGRRSRVWPAAAGLFVLHFRLERTDLQASIIKIREVCFFELCLYPFGSFTESVSITLFQLVRA